MLKLTKNITLYDHLFKEAQYKHIKSKLPVKRIANTFNPDCALDFAKKSHRYRQNAKHH